MLKKLATIICAAAFGLAIYAPTTASACPGSDHDAKVAKDESKDKKEDKKVAKKKAKAKDSKSEKSEKAKSKDKAKKDKKITRR